MLLGQQLGIGNTLCSLAAAWSFMVRISPRLDFAMLGSCRFPWQRHHQYADAASLSLRSK